VQDCSKRALGWLGLGRRLDCRQEVVDGVDGEPADRDALVVIHAAQRSERLRQRVHAINLDVAICANDHSPHGGDVARDLFEQEERGLIGPVQIVEEDDQRARLRHVAQEGGDALEQARALGLGIETWCDFELRHAAPYLRHEDGDVGCTGP
jgi:hypothetical protein